MISGCARWRGSKRRCARILDANGFAGRPIGEAMEALGKDPRFHFSNDDKGRAEALAEYTRLITQAMERSKQLFADSAQGAD